MELSALKTAILANKIPNMLVFEVEEPTLARQYIDKISSTTNKPPKFYDKAEEAIYDFTTNLRDDYVFVIQDSRTAKIEDLWDACITPDRHIIIYLSEIDRKSKFYRDNQDYVVPFKKVDTYSLLAYLQKLCKINSVEISQDKLLRVIEFCNGDLGCILNEMDKIFVMQQDNSNLLVEYMEKEGFSDYRKVNVYTMVDKIMKKNTSALYDIQKLSESPVGILVLIYTNARRNLFYAKDEYYSKVMLLCIDMYNKIISGKMGAEYALKYVLYQLILGGSTE